MLDPEYLQEITDGSVDIADELHTDIIRRIVERIMHRLGRGDDYILTQTDKWQIDVLQDAGYLLESITADIAKYTKLQQTEIKAAMEDAGIKAVRYDDQMYKGAGLSPKPLLQSPQQVRLMQRNYEATLGTWKNFTRTTAQEAQKLFINECDKAYNMVSSGALSYTQAVKEAVDTAISDGGMVSYPTGHTDTIETATMRAVRTGVAQATGDIQMQRMIEMDWDIILVSSHLGARTGNGEETAENHSWWQGKFYSRTGKDKRFPLFSVTGYGTATGLCGINCRHSFGPGDGENNPYRQYDSEENKKAYELSQKQRALERRVRKTKREVAALQAAVDNCEDEKLKFELQQKLDKKSYLLKQQNERYNTFCEENGLKPYRERLQTVKWDREKAARAAGAARRYGNIAEKQESSQGAGSGYKDVLDEWLQNAAPNSNAVEELTEYTVKGTTYKVDGVNVRQNNSKREIEVAELIKNTFGGEIKLVPEVKGKYKGVKTPDYEYRGQRWDLKELGKGSSSNLLRDIAHKKKDQAECFVFDISKSILSYDEISRQVECLFTTYFNTKHVECVMIIKGNQILRVIERK